MTCVLPTTPWQHHFNDHIPWLSMNSDAKSTQLPPEQPLSQRYVSPGSDTRKSSTSSGKKRASRAGTRSVSTLSAAQLERKRANDREAQRAIRQRTKDHIDHLERSINELRGSQEANEKLVHVTQQRNRELEDEIAFLRTKLGEAGYNVGVLPSEHSRSHEQALLSVPSTSPVHSSGVGMPRAGSVSTPSSHSVASTGSRHGSWQHPTAGFVGSSNTAMALPGAAAVSSAPNLTTWRSHENLQSNSTIPSNLQDPTSGSYHQDQRVDWQVSPTSYQPYVTQEPSRSEQYETASAQQQHGFQTYGASSPQTSGYHSQVTSQNEFSALPVSSSPSTYQTPSHATFPQVTSFQVTPIQISASDSDYTSPSGQMQPPPLPTSTFQSGRGEQAFGTQQQFRDDGASRQYSLTQFGTA